MIIHSLKGMLPKNKMRENYLKNILIYDGPFHDLHVLGLPQFGDLTPVNYNVMFGTEFNPQTDVILTDNKEEKAPLIEDYKQKGFRVMDTDSNYYRDFNQTGKEQIKIKPALRVMERIRKKRMRIYAKVNMKAYKYL